MLGLIVGDFLKKKGSARVIRTILNLWPPFLASGISIDRIAPDFMELDVSAKQRWSNSNFAGTFAGGPLYEMVDPFVVLLLYANLGPDYLVWDKSVKIQFKRPGTGKVFAKFKLLESDIASLREQVSREGKGGFTYAVSIVDGRGKEIANIEKGIAIALKNGKKPGRRR